jgi:hypothetical protein
MTRITDLHFSDGFERTSVIDVVRLRRRAKTIGRPGRLGPPFSETTRAAQSDKAGIVAVSPTLNKGNRPRLLAKWVQRVPRPPKFPRLEYF